MPKVTINLADELFAELQTAARETGEQHYGPASWASDLIASELAARRLPRIAPGRLGGRPGSPGGSAASALEPYRVALPVVEL